MDIETAVPQPCSQARKAHNRLGLDRIHWTKAGAKGHADAFVGIRATETRGGRRGRKGGGAGETVRARVGG